MHTWTAYGRTLTEIHDGLVVIVRRYGNRVRAA
jgi:hypothetical protein